jgi:homogentisate 1,2-dioxygenase
MYPLNKGITTRQAHVALPTGTYEEEHGRDGFYGPVSHLYRTHAPTNWTRIEGPMRPRAFHCNRLPVNAGRDAIADRTLMLSNSDVAVHFSRPSVPMGFYFRNADGDEVYFVHRGHGIFETDFGPLYFETGDYIVIPRGTTYRILPETADNAFLVIESFSRIRQPERGLLGQHALYDPAIVKTPEPQPIHEDAEWEVRVKRLNEMTSIFYPFNPMDVVGWKGDLSVWQLNIRDIRPVISHRAHLAPSVHSTFQGNGFVVCSFVPRPLESDPDAVRVPFYHRNIDYDEVLFYHDGQFFSRHGVEAGMLTVHPQGIHHGPHPQAVEASLRKTETDEYAVMLDTEKPLTISEQAQSAEWKDYFLSWRPTAESSKTSPTANGASV